MSDTDLERNIMKRRNFLKAIACLPIWSTIQLKTNITSRTVADRPVYTEEFLEDWESDHE